jgi:hypothetical protein
MPNLKAKAGLSPPIAAEEAGTMQNTPYTPGPWTVDGHADNQIVWSGPDERVCFLAHSNGQDTQRDIATGLLISAAPDLLEAARNAVKFIEEYHPNAAFNGHTDALRAAIAKAEGGAE